MKVAKKLAIAAFLMAACAVTAPAYAHHSVSAFFDVSKTMQLEGVIKEFKFQNPHSTLIIYAEENGKQVEWRCESNLAAWLVRNGWKPSMFPAGTKVKLTVNPPRDASVHNARLVTITLPDGKKFQANTGKNT